MEFIIGNTQISFCVSNTNVIELVHNQRQIDALHASVVTPGFAQTMCTKVAAQAHLLTDDGDDFLSFASLLFFNPKMMPDSLLVIQEMFNTRLQHV